MQLLSKLQTLAGEIGTELGILTPYQLLLGDTSRISYSDDLHDVIIEISETGAYPESALAHELYHLLQLQTGRLASTLGLVYWLGEFYTSNWIIQMHGLHEELPWEAEAIQYEREWATRNGYGYIDRPNYSDQQVVNG